MHITEPLRQKEMLHWHIKWASGSANLRAVPEPLDEDTITVLMLTQQFGCIVKWRPFLSIHAFKRRAGWGVVDVVYNERAHAHVGVCTNPSWCLVESDTSASGAFQEIMEAARSFLRSSPDQPPPPMVTAADYITIKTIFQIRCLHAQQWWEYFICESAYT